MNRPLQPGDRKCASTVCRRAAVARGVCGSHFNPLKRGEDIHRPLQVPTIARKGEWIRSKKGYLYKNVVIDGRTVQVAQHREVMEGILGRALLSEEEVHHKNGQKDDNRPSNLELWSTSQPAGQRVEDKIEWAREILALYTGVET